MGYYSELDIENPRRTGCRVRRQRETFAVQHASRDGWKVHSTDTDIFQALRIAQQISTIHEAARVVSNRQGVLATYVETERIVMAAHLEVIVRETAAGYYIALCRNGPKSAMLRPFFGTVERASEYAQNVAGVLGCGWRVTQMEQNDE